MRGHVRTLLNIVQSQIGWFACVLSAAAGRPWIGLTVVAVLIVLHVARADSPRREIVLILVAALVGAIADTLLVQVGLLNFSSTALAGVSPPWMIALWMIFATTLRHSLAGLQTRLALAAVVAAVGGPLAYAAGVRLGALRIADASSAYFAIAAVWAIAFPALLWTAHRLDRGRSSFPRSSRARLS